MFVAWSLVFSLMSLSSARPTATPQETGTVPFDPSFDFPPQGIDGNSIHGYYFMNTSSKAFRPAVEAAPILFMARDGCSPEDARNTNGDGPNPGTEPGEPTEANCHRPSSWSVLPAPGFEDKVEPVDPTPFPIYITARHCEDDDTWRVNYGLYWANDGLGHKSGHKHDWENTMVIWRREKAELDWWTRDRVWISAHNGGEKRTWHNLRSSNNESTFNNDKAPSNGGPQGKHPHVYVGMKKHANFYTEGGEVDGDPVTKDEYRSKKDLAFLPTTEQMRDGPVEILAEWQDAYEKADSTPSKMYERMCDK